MLIRTVLVIALQIVHALSDENNSTNDAKSKRGIYQISDGSDYSVVPLHHLARLPHVRALADASQVDITYKPNDEYQQNQYEVPEPVKLPSNTNYKINEQTFSAQQHIPTYAANHYHQLNHRPTAEQLPQQHGIPTHYPINLHPRVSAHLPLYNADKPITLPANIRTSSDIDSFGTIPIIYGQSNGNLPSLKYVQTYPAKSPYQTIQSFTQQPYLQQFKPQAKYPTQNLQLRHLQTNPALYKSQYYQPQVFDNPIVPQLQHYLPQIQSPFDAFTKPVTSAPLIIAKPTPKQQEAPKKSAEDDDDDDEDEEEDDEDDEQHQRREEVKGEIIRHESNDEEDFDRGYDDAARDFPAHRHRDDDDDDDHPRHRYRNEDYDAKYQKYKARYGDRDHEYRSRRPYDHDDDPEAHYSEKHSKKQNKSPKTESRKRVRTEAKEHHKSSGKYQTKSAPKKTYYSNNKKPSKNPREASASTKSEIGFKPSYQYGFEPMKTTIVDKSNSKRNNDSEAKSSSPIQMKKIYKENWYISKTSNA